MLQIKSDPSPHILRSFGRTMLIGFGAIGAIIWLLAWRKGLIPGLVSWSGSGAQIAAVLLWTIGVGLFVLSRFAPGPARHVYVIWMTVANAVGFVMSTILLTLMFLLILPLFSVIVRRSDPLRKRLINDGTCWEDYKHHEPTLERMRRLF